MVFFAVRRSTIPSSPTKAPPQMNRMFVVSTLMNSCCGCLRPPLGRDVGDGPLQDLEERLLHPFARHVARDGRVLGLPGDLVDLVDVDDPPLRLLHVVVGGLQQRQDDVLDVLAHVPGLGERGRVGDGERDVQDARQRLGEQGLPAAGGPQQEDVRLLQLDAVGPLRLDPLVMVVDGDGEDLLGPLLADHVFVESLLDFRGLGEAATLFLETAVDLVLFGDDVVAQLDALVADVDRGPGDELAHLVLRLPAEGADQQVRLVVEFPGQGGLRQSTSGLGAGLRLATT
jgi:hypothetical protein